MRFRFILFLFFPAQIALSQGISGIICDKDKNPVPFATVFVPKLNKGTTSNTDGRYSLPLPKGTWVVEFRSISFKTAEKSVRIDDQFVDLPVKLEERMYRIPEIKVTASGEDPAVYIMRKAIALAPYYKNQVSKYSCRVYLKGSGILKEIPGIIKKKLEKEGIKENFNFTMESLSNVDFELPDKLKQVVIAQQTTGEGNNSSPMAMITSSLYNSTNYGAISPFSQQALKVYDFKLLSMFEDQGRMVNKIQVTPKINGRDVFSGTLNIIEGFWSLHSADLSLNPPLMKARMKQVYSPVNEDVWMPVSLNFDIDMQLFGFDVGYSYVSSISDYKVTLNPSLDHSFIKDQQMILARENELFNKSNPSAIRETRPQKPENSNQMAMMDSLMKKESLTLNESRKLKKLIEKEAHRDAPPEKLEIEDRVTIDPKARTLDSLTWDSIRPVPLTRIEITSFHRKDSILKISNTKEYKDSVAENRKKFKIKHIFSGKTYLYNPVNSQKENTLKIPGIFSFDGLHYNTVDGYSLGFPLLWFKSDTLGHFFTINSRIGYAFARQKINGSLGFSWGYNGKKRAIFSLKGGSSSQDFNPESGMSPFINDIYSLVFERNYKKFFQRNFITLQHQFELTNGMMLQTAFSWSDRQPLVNNTGHRYFDWSDRHFTENVPVNEGLSPSQLERSRSAIIGAQIDWTPMQRYRIRNGFKYQASSKYPTFSLLYKKALPDFLQGNADYDYLQGSIRKRFSLGLGNSIDLNLTAGGFLNRNRIYFADFKHFRTEYTDVMTRSYLNSYLLLPYYEPSTSKGFSEGHASFSSGRLMLKRLPFLSNSIFSEKLSVNYLNNDHFRNYTELSYGIENLFLFVDLKVAAGFEAGKFRSAGFKIGLNLPSE